MPLYSAPTATDNLKGPGAEQAFRHPETAQDAVLFHPKSYRIHLRSQDRLNADDDANVARFNLRDLAAQWNLKHRNLDAGSMLWRMKLASFVMAAPLFSDTPYIVSVHAKGFPQQSESWSSETEGNTDLLAVLAGSGSSAYLENADAITLHSLPEGNVEIQVRITPTTIESATTLMWELVLNIESAKNPGAVPRPAA